MEFSIATLLSHLTEDKLVAPKMLERKLGCEDETSVQKLHIALDILEKIGILAKERGKYRRIYQEDLVEAKLRCSSKGFCFAIQDSEETEDIYIRETNVHNAWNGDRVLIKVLKEGNRKRSPEGEVKLVLERNHPKVLARIKATDSGYHAIPLDDRLLFELKLQSEDFDLEQLVDHLVHVQVLRYPLAQQLPLAKIVRILGSDQGEPAPIDIVCCKHDLSRDFSLDTLAYTSALSAQLINDEIPQRVNFRHLPTLSINPDFLPQTIGDSSQLVLPIIESAFTVENTLEGDFRLGIHIADVAHFIDFDSPLNKEAKKRGTAIYLGEMVLPLVPNDLIKICSLVTGEDKLVISVMVTINANGEILEFEIQPAVINVDYHLTSQQISNILAGEEQTEQPILELLHQLFDKIIPAIKNQREQRGSFTLNVKNQALSVFADTDRYGAVIINNDQETKTGFQELTILANQVIAKHLQILEVPAIYCQQKPAETGDIQDVMKLAINMNLDLHLAKEVEILPRDFQHFIEMFAQTEYAQILNNLLRSTLKQVEYSTHSGFNFALSLEEPYTQAVSPLRRYADLIIQYVLHQIFTNGRDRKTSRSKETVDLRHSNCHGQITWNVLPTEIHEELSNHISFLINHLKERQRIAIDAENDLQGLSRAKFMQTRTGEVFTGLIIGMQSYGFFVEIFDLGIEGLVHVSSLKDDWYEFRPRNSCLVGRRNRMVYRLGDVVQVQVKSVDYYRQQIDLTTINNAVDFNVNEEEII